MSSNRNSPESNSNDGLRPGTVFRRGKETRYSIVIQISPFGLVRGIFDRPRLPQVFSPEKPELLDKLRPMDEKDVKPTDIRGFLSKNEVKKALRRGSPIGPGRTKKDQDDIVRRYLDEWGQR